MLFYSVSLALSVPLLDFVSRCVVKISKSLIFNAFASFQVQPTQRRVQMFESAFDSVVLYFMLVIINLKSIYLLTTSDTNQAVLKRGLDKSNETQI